VSNVFAFVALQTEKLLVKVSVCKVARMPHSHITGEISIEQKNGKKSQTRNLPKM
jgi:hypothetical protein